MASENRVVALNVIGDAMARPLAEYLANPDNPKIDLSNLMALANGGAPISAAVRTQFSKALPTSILIDSYGSSETGTTGIEQGAEKHTAPRFTMGPETTVFTKDFVTCEPGEQGMLARSGHIPIGYYNDPEKTAETFCEVDGRRWVMSGDYATVDDDGQITILGRGSLSINTGGEKVHPEEVEAALKEYPDVMDAAVIGTPSDVWGEQVTALVQLRPDAELDAEALKQHCKKSVAGYKVPKDFLVVDEVPHTPVGKVDYKTVRNRALEMLTAGSVESSR